MTIEPHDVLEGRAPMHLAAPVNLQAAEQGEDGKPKLRRFKMLAYSGSAMNFWWSDTPVVVDVSGLEGTDKSRPILRDHNHSDIVGHTELIATDGGKIEIVGVVSADTDSARQVVAAADNGFPWEASIGVEMRKVEYVKAGKQVEVNNQTFEGPIRIVRAGVFKETSFVALGADDNTEAAMVARLNSDNANLSRKENKMADQEKHGAEPQNLEAHDDPLNIQAQLEAARKEHAAEARRISAIRKLCAGHGDIEAKAIEDGWSVDKAELEVLRASRHSGNFGHSSNSKEIGAKTLEAAALKAAGVAGDYDDKTMEAADRVSREYGGMNLTTLFLAAARANGWSGQSTKVNREVLQAAFGNLQAAGYSNIDVGGILSNIANKMLLQGFMGVEQAWASFADVQTATDFKTMHRYRLTGDATFEKVANGGEIQAGSLGEVSYSNKVDTFAKLFGISRQDFINDDLSALTTVPRKLGRGGALKLNQVFWSEWLDDASFFTGGNDNYITGANTALSMDGLKAAITAFRRQTDPDGNPLGIEPSVLIVPPELEAIALELTRSTTVNTGGASSVDQVPNANIYQGRFRVAVSQYLDAAKVWYLAANPMDLASIEVAFLNGQRTPFVEQADADFSTLGVQMRGYFDFGVAKQDHRGAIKAKGEA